MSPNEIVNAINNVEWDSNGDPLYSYPQVVIAINEYAKGEKHTDIDMPCCEVLEKMKLGWMTLEDGTRCMPYIRGHADTTMYRINNCPSCGKYIRDIMIKK